jgi:hypothetical protein
LRHEPLVAYPGAELWKTVGGGDGVAALIKDLYRRIEQDECCVRRFRTSTTPFFLQWFGGSCEYLLFLDGGSGIRRLVVSPGPCPEVPTVVHFNRRRWPL